MTLTVLKTPTANVTPHRSLAAVHAIVVHTTGQTDLDKILEYYSGSDDKVNPHCLIETTGLVRRFADEEAIAYHCKLYPEERAAYGHGYSHWSRCLWDDEKKAVIVTGDEQPNYAQWKASWPTLRSPLEHPTGSYPNQVSVGVELLQPLPTQVTPDIFLDAQYEALALLIHDICQRLEVPVERRNILGHYDVSPLRRSDKNGGWDPGAKFNWKRLFALLREIV